MSTVARIKCFACGNSFEYYFNIHGQSGGEITCPHCLTPMERQSVGKVLSAIGHFDDVNRELRRYASDRGEPLFQLDLAEIQVMTQPPRPAN